MANQFLALSLFVMLLSFFIVINAMSNFEEAKARPVLRSISVAFSTKSLVEEKAPSFVDAAGDSYTQGDSIDHIEALFRAEITGVDITKNSQGTVMHVRLPVRSFERGVSAAGENGLNPDKAKNGTGGFFLPMLVSLLQAKKTAIPYHMEILLNIPQNPAEAFNKNPKIVSDALKKASGYAESLEAAGLPAKLVNAGLALGKEGYVDLYFRRYHPINPLTENVKQEVPGEQ